jgi:aminopeptidase-like protein
MQPDLGRLGTEMHELISGLFPIHRSITGAGLRETLTRVQQEIPLVIHEVPTGTKVFDWTVPEEWKIRDAWVKNASGTRVIDLRQSNLHVVGYSVPVHCTLSLAELRSHLHSLPDQPDLIPYRTTYYREGWGFCLSQNQMQTMQDGEYEVCIDSTLAPGALTYGEYFVPGDSPEEVLISCHCCHPSLANDNLSGIALATMLGRRAAIGRLPLSYRFLFIPATIGSITWLARNEMATTRIKHGLVLSCVGDPGPVTYKRSRRGNALIDRAAAHVFRHRGVPERIRDFAPEGYDERQYCSPGFDLPVGCFTRTPNGLFREYHSSGDNLAFVTAESLADSLATVTEMLEIVEYNRSYVNLNPMCEPQLGRRGLFHGLGGRAKLPDSEMALLWVLSLSDGGASLLDIAERSGIRFSVVRHAAETLRSEGLIREA